jgi:phosphatidylglycerophosphate synthase
MGRFGLGGWFVILAATCDVYDGMLARAQKISLKSGAFFDSTLDRVGETAMFFGLLYFFKDQTLWFILIFLLVAASQLVSYARARAEGLGFDKMGSRGFFQRAERMIVLSIGMPLTPFFDMFLPKDSLVFVTILFIAAGSIITAVSRSVGIYREIRLSEK